MNEIEQTQAFISTADEVTLTALESTINETRKTRIAERNAALPEFPFVVSRYGHAAPIQVTRAKAIELISAGGTHRLATAEDLGHGTA